MQRVPSKDSDQTADAQTGQSLPLGALIIPVFSDHKFWVLIRLKKCTLFKTLFSCKIDEDDDLVFYISFIILSHMEMIVWSVYLKFLSLSVFQHLSVILR